MNSIKSSKFFKKIHDTRMTQVINDQPIFDFTAKFQRFRIDKDKESMKKCLEYALRMVKLFSQDEKRRMMVFHDPLYNYRPLFRFLSNVYDQVMTCDAFQMKDYMHAISVMDAMSVGIVGPMMLRGHDRYFETLHATLQNFIVTGDEDHLYITKSIIDVLGEKYVEDITE